MNKIWLLASLLILLNSGTLNAQPPAPPSIKPTQCSLNGGAPTQITFVNQAEEVVSVYWIDYQCNLQFYKSLAPSESYEQPTYAKHPWLVIGAVTEQVLLKVIGTPTSQVVYIPEAQLSRTTQCSTQSDIATRITFVNRSTETVLVYWVDYDCNLRFNRSLAPGESYKEETFVTHPWIMIGSATRQILAKAVGIVDRQTVDIPRTALSRSTTDRPDDIQGYQVQIFYVLPSDGIDQQLDTNDTLLKSVYAWNEWLAQQTTGTRLRLDTYGGQIDIVFVQLNSTDTQLAAEGVYIRDRIERELDQLGFNHPQKLYGVYYGGTAHETCGGGPLPPDLVGRVVALYLNGQFTDPNIPDCNQNAFGVTGSMGYWEFSMLHEIFHALGAVPECAPHHTRRGHSSDTPHDLMYAGDERWQPQVVDEGHDDYYGHNNADCLDIADSAFLDPLPANPVLPPRWETLQ